MTKASKQIIISFINIKNIFLIYILLLPVFGTGIDFQESILFYSLPPIFFLILAYLSKNKATLNLTKSGICFQIILITFFTISTVFSLNIGHSFYKLSEFLTILLLFNIFHTFFSQDITKLLKFSVIIGIFYSTIFIFDKIGILPLSVKDFGDNFILQVWGHSNLASFIIFPIIHLLSTLNKKPTATLTLSLSIMLIAFSLTMSRISIIALILGLATIPNLSKLQKRLKHLIIFSSLLLLTLLTYQSFNSHNPYKTPTGSRPTYWLHGIRGFIESPLIGHGAGTFTITNQKLKNIDDVGTITAHNSIIDFLHSHGIFFTAIFYIFILLGLKYQYQHHRHFFSLGLVGLIYSLFNPSWNAPGIFLLSLIFIFHDFTPFFSKLKNTSSIYLSILPIVIFVFFILKTISDFLFLNGQYSQSLRFDPLNLNSQLAVNQPSALNLYRHEALIYRQLITSTPFPQSSPFYLKLIELQPHDTQIIIDFMKLSNQAKVNDAFTQTSTIDTKNLSHYQKLSIAKEYYLYALRLWNLDQKQSLIYFEKSTRFASNQSHFYLEYASALWHNQQTAESQKIISECQQNPFAQKHCLQFAKDYPQKLPTPGVFQETITSL